MAKILFNKKLEKLEELGYIGKFEGDFKLYLRHSDENFPTLRLGRIDCVLCLHNERTESAYKEIDDIDSFYKKYSRLVKLKKLMR